MESPSELTSITIPNSIAMIDHATFSECRSLVEITIPNSVTCINDYAFDNCLNLTKVTLSNSLYTIGVCAFRSCHSLTEVTIPNSVEGIGVYAFFGCESLRSVYCKPTAPPAGGLYMFHLIHSSAKIYVPSGSVNSYMAAEFWSDYRGRIVSYN